MQQSLDDVNEKRWSTKFLQYKKEKFVVNCVVDFLTRSTDSRTIGCTYVLCIKVVVTTGMEDTSCNLQE